MISVTPRENTALQLVRLLLFPTGRNFSSSLALAARRGPAHAKTCKMILLCMDNAKSPGMILLHKMTLKRGAFFALRTFPRRISLRICTLEENRSRKGRAGKSFTMISLCDAKNNLPGMILLRKKVGAPLWGALSMPNWRSNQSSAKTLPTAAKVYQQDELSPCRKVALFAGNKVIPSEHRERGAPFRSGRFCGGSLWAIRRGLSS